MTLTKSRLDLIPKLLQNSAANFPNKPALARNDGSGNLITLSYGDFWSRAVKIASFLRRSGFGHGDNIALVGQNSFEWSIAYFAIQCSGCTVVPLDSMQKPAELRHIVRHSSAKALFYDAKFKAIIEDEEELLFPELPSFDLKKLDGIARAEASPSHPHLDYPDSTPAVIIYTSGTTGSPKGVVLTHKNILANLADILRRINFSEKDTFLSVLPAHHAFEATCGFLTPITMGCTVCFSRVLRAKELLEDIATADATLMVGVPMLFEKFHAGIIKGVEKKGFVARQLFGSAMGASKLIDGVFGGHAGKLLMKPFRRKAGFGKMRLMVSGGAAVKPEVVRFFNNFGISFLQGYGLSETSPVLSANPEGKNKPETVGPPLESVTVRIANPDANGIGEIQARGASIFGGYYKNPSASDEAFTNDGWFRTGDLGFLDSEGYITIAGREKNLIVTAGGKNVYPEEIEEKLSCSPFVLECLIIGQQRDADEEVFAIIVPNFDALDEFYHTSLSDSALEGIFKEIVEKVNSSMASYKRIRGFRLQQEEFPKTSTKKIKRYLFSGKKISL